MKNLIIFLSTFTLTVLLAVFMSTPANALTIPAVDGQCLAGWTLNSQGSCTSNSIGNGAGGSWDCPYGSDPVTGECMGSGGGSGGGGAGGSWGETCTWSGTYGSGIATSFSDACAKQAIYAARGFPPLGRITTSVVGGKCMRKDTWYPSDAALNVNLTSEDCEQADTPPTDKPWIPSPDFPDVPPINPDGSPCDPCKLLNDINRKLNVIKNYDIKNINQTIYDMSYVINNINNSINDLSVNQQVTNNYLTNIDNSIGDVITNIENNNITQNEIKNEITNIYETMNDYSLQLGDIKLAMGDIEVKLDNTNKLVLDLRPDIEFIKNNLVNGSPQGKDYTEQLNQIIELLKPCEPTAEKTCPDDDEVVRKLKEIQDFMQADFVPDTDSTAVEVEDLTNIELDRNLIKFGVAQCPPDNEFSTMVNGFSFSGGFKHKPLCDFFTLLSPFIKAFGGFSAALILGGGLRRG